MLAREQTSDFLYNLSVVIRRDYLEPRMLGIAGSVISVWQRAQGKAAEAKLTLNLAATSHHFGTEKERLHALPVTLLHVIPHENEWGTTYITKLVTDDGCVAIWFAHAPFAKPEEDGGALVEPGERVYLTGTVTKHDQRDGVAQTILSRCIVLSAKGAELELNKKAKKAARAAKLAATAAGA